MSKTPIKKNPKAKGAVPKYPCDKPSVGWGKKVK